MVQGWKLNVDNFTLLDRLKICKFFLSKRNKWTQGKYVKEYEKAWAEYTGCKYAVMFSSGSTANTSIAQYVQKKYYLRPIKVTPTVLVPSVTWQTSVSPWLFTKFRIKFIDVGFDDFCMDTNKLSDFLKDNHSIVSYIWPTSLLGFNPNIKEISKLSRMYKIPFGLDNCENAFGEIISNTEDGSLGLKTHICKVATSSVSTYFGHHTTSTEGGFVITDDKEEYEFHLMNRSHGMTRSLKDYDIDPSPYRNPLVDPSFDFYSEGSNFRATDIEAFIGLLDFKRINDYIEKRRALYSYFSGKLDNSKFILPKFDIGNYNVPFCLPIISRDTDSNKVTKAKAFCEKNNIEHRQVIGGNMLRQRPYRHMEDHNDFPVAEHIHKYGFYVGLNQQVEESKILNLTDYLNSL
tara:strand:+ start:530 stop:1744 length:1215 start_codon:yes stop_codon:yes gene_type:complete